MDHRWPKCEDSVWLIGSLVRAHRPFPPPLADSERFDVYELDDRQSPLWADSTGSAQWLELLRFFDTVENLHLSEGLALCLAPALQELTTTIGEGVVTEVLPALQTVFIERFQPSESGPIQVAIGKFVTAREFSGHPVTCVV